MGSCCSNRTTQHIPPHILTSTTGIAFALTVVGAGQLVYNSRRRKAEWLVQQKLREVKELGIALEAEAAGTATEEQILRINQDRARRDAEAERVGQRGMLDSVRQGITGSITEKADQIDTTPMPPPLADPAPSATGPLPTQTPPAPELAPAKSTGWFGWLRR